MYTDIRMSDTPAFTIWKTKDVIASLSQTLALVLSSESGAWDVIYVCLTPQNRMLPT